VRITAWAGGHGVTPPFFVGRTHTPARRCLTRRRYVCPLATGGPSGSIEPVTIPLRSPPVANQPAHDATVPTPRYFEYRSARLYYEVAGAGPPVVLLHGLSGSTRWWTHNVTPLAQSFCVYRVDLIGFGRSRGQRFGLHDAARLLVAWMDSLDLARAHLVGHSMVGYIATDLAVQVPERVDRLVLVDAAAVPFHRTYAHDALGLVRALRYLPFNFLPVLIGDAMLSGPLTLLQALREIVAGDLTDRLAQIQAPTLVVWGEHDTVIPVAVGRRLAELVPNAEWALIPGAGHNPMWDRPAAFNQLVLEFLSRGLTPPAGNAP
jgi:pimeloyl-ACP methyl ester carboxylesterase